ncbi:MAG: multidrug DMT transporter permease [Ignavibacteriales bacterium CG18_big_fil_WC_8_21_14_2_50_31_20]|nr:MAG: multidrug DMT transporter permease [Ignavibacteriales bacterium CG18_big_fil_WC_8_21_14_2_50_31_20]
MKSESFKIGLGYILITLLWGSTWLAIRVGLDSLTPMFAVGLRFFIASFFVFIVMKISKVKLQTDPLSIKLYLFLAFFSFIIPFTMVYWGEQFVPSGLTSIIFAVFPLFVILFSWLMIPNEHVGIYKLIGVLIGFIGIIIIFWKDMSLDLSENSLGMIAILVSAIIQGLVAVVIKKHGNKLNPLSMNFIPLLISGIVLIPAGLIFEDSSSLVFDTKAISSILYLAFFGTVITFTTYYWLMQKINVVILSLSSFITPIIALILGIIFLSEKFDTNHIWGSSLVLMGILFANFRGLFNYYKVKEKRID